MHLQQRSNFDARPQVPTGDHQSTKQPGDVRLRRVLPEALYELQSHAEVREAELLQEQNAVVVVSRGH